MSWDRGLPYIMTTKREAYSPSSANPNLGKIKRGKAKRRLISGLPWSGNLNPSRNVRHQESERL